MKEKQEQPISMGWIKGLIQAWFGSKLWCYRIQHTSEEGQKVHCLKHNSNNKDEHVDSDGKLLQDGENIWFLTQIYDSFFFFSLSLLGISLKQCLVEY